jgi:hypothetical protein
MGQRHGLEACADAADLITTAADGHGTGTAEITAAVMTRLTTN